MSIDFNTQAGAHVRVSPEKASTQDKSAQDDTAFWGADGFGFDDLVDLINPLQHIPIVSSIYRELTGDEIAPGPRMIGGAVLGGVTGFVASAANVIFEQATGGDIGEQVLALFSGDEEADPKVTTQAAASKEELVVASRAPTPLLEFPPVSSLQPLDFGVLGLPSELPEKSQAGASVKPPAPTLSELEFGTEEKYSANTGDTLEALFGTEVAAAHRQYRNSQLMLHVMDVEQELKA